MKKIMDSDRSFNSRGSTLAVILVVTIALGFVIASTFSYTLTEARLNRSDLLANEARLATESVLEHGIGQLRRRFDATHQLTPEELIPSSATGLKVESEFVHFLINQGGTRVVAPSSSSWANHQAFIDESTVLGAVVLNQGNPVTVEIDPNDPLPDESTSDSALSTRVREVRVYAKAKVADDQWGEREAYARKTFQVLDESLFQYAVYFADDLELWPGANMNIGEGGPIYGGNIYLGVESGSKLSVHSRLLTPGIFKAGGHPGSHRPTNIPQGEIQLRDMAAGDDSSDYLKDLKSANPAGTHLQTGVPDFRTLALQAFNHGLRTREHGVEPQAPVGLEPLRQLTSEGANLNPGHHLIAPKRDESFYDARIEADSTEREIYKTIEESKWATKSALTLELTDHSSENPQVILRNQDGNVVSFDDVNFEPFWDIEKFQEDSNGVTSGLYDFRQSGGNANSPSGRINLVRLDMEKMKLWVEDPAVSIPWNGGVYVKMPEVSDPGRDDYVIPARSDWAVQIHNAAVLPNRRAVDLEAARGLTLATNSALYVHGDFNAPNGGGTRTLPENSSTFGDPGHEAPAALIADAVTILSNNWTNQNSKSSKDSHRVASDTVVSAAIISGNVLSNGTFSGNTKYSGGVENFPRFLEKWSNKKLTYRGSMINLYRSESHKERWGHSDVYDAPTRDWGFNQGFRTYTPPLDPGTRIFRQINFVELTRERFVSETQNLYNPD